MRKVIKFTFGLLAIEPAATRLSQPIIPSEVLKMLHSWVSGNGPAPLLPDPIGAEIGMASFTREPTILSLEGVLLPKSRIIPVVERGRSPGKKIIEKFFVLMNKLLF